MSTRIALRVVLLALALAGGGCSDDVIGKYVAVDIDKTLEGITNVPVVLSNQMALPEYREHIKKRYTDKTLELTADHPHEFLVGVPLQGTVRGLFYGGWMRDEKDKRVILIYEWVSGSMYLLWGRATLSNKDVTVLLEGGTNAPILHFRKVE